MDTKAFWNERAALGEQAGTQDLVAAELERRAIAKHVKDGMMVLDVGCGNGTTAIELAQRFDIKITGVDTAHQMLEAAWDKVRYTPLEDRALFLGCDVPDGLGALGRGWDLIYTQRCLINLSSWPTQERAIRNILDLLKPGGKYLMIENSIDGLEFVNECRKGVGLPKIVPPGHNRYLNDYEPVGLATTLLYEQVIDDADYVDYSGLYYLLSRTVNAYLATQEGHEPAYDSPINQLALKLPSVPGIRGQGRMWIWQKSK